MQAYDRPVRASERLSSWLTWSVTVCSAVNLEARGPSIIEGNLGSGTWTFVHKLLVDQSGGYAYLV